MKVKKKKKSRLAVVFLCVAAVFALLWGGAELLRNLTHYGENATLGTQEQPGQPDEPAENTQTQENGLIDGLPANPHNEEDFAQKGGFTVYTGPETWNTGVDVSSHQGEIDWKKAAADGIQFAIIRIGYRGYTEGSIQEDAYFEQNLAGAIDAGLDVGVYFFSQAMDEQEAREEARFVLDKISGYQLAYPVFFDWEKIGADARSDAMDLTSLTTVTDTFCSEIEAAGYQAGLYFNQQLGYEELHLPSLQGYTFWLAEYNDTPSFTYDFYLWQFASDGSVDGIDGDVDLNLAFIGK